MFYKNDFRIVTIKKKAKHTESKNQKQTNINITTVAWVFCSGGKTAVCSLDFISARAKGHRVSPVISISKVRETAA